VLVTVILGILAVFAEHTQGKHVTSRNPKTEYSGTLSRRKGASDALSRMVGQAGFSER
jgi:hypothetical protein